MQGIFNAMDGWHIKGENFNFVFRLYQSFAALRETLQTQGEKGDKPTQPWFGAGDIDLRKHRQQIKQILQDFLMAGVPAERLRCCGFKEIRYVDILNQDTSGDTLRQYLDFMVSLLDDCRLVFLWRDPEDTCNSGWWQNIDRSDALAQLNRFKSFALDYCAVNPKISFCLCYEDIISRTDNFDALFSFLGEAPAPDKLQQVLMTPHSYSLRSFSAQSAPQNAGSPSRSALLKEADRLYALGKFESAESLYREYVQSYEMKEVDRLPFYVAVRAGRKAYVVRASKQHALAYFPIPKNACSSLSRLIWELINGKIYDGNNIHKEFQFARAEFTLSKYENYYKFVVIRDPIERFVSGYRNRIVYHHDLAPLLKSSGRAGRRPDINEFADQLENYIARDKSVANHFQPQCLRLGDDLNVFDAVVPIEHTDSLVAVLSHRVGQDLTLGRYQSGGPEMSIHDLSENALLKLLSFYAEDYTLLTDFYSPEKIKTQYYLKK